MTTGKTAVTLVNFFVFNDTLGPKEGDEHKKILYYHPATENIDNKIKTVGLVEAISKFSETFTDKPARTLHTQRRRQVYCNPEKHFWLAMTLTIPVVVKNKEGQVYHEYHDEDVQDSVFEDALLQAYKMYKFFMGTFTSATQKEGVASLRKRLEHFYTRYLGTQKLNQCDILDVFNGLHFLPLDKNTYLRIQCFTNLLEATFPQIKYTAFLYNDQLVWSGLEQEDMRVMYKYLTTTLIPSTLEQEFQAGAAVGSMSSHYGRFITGPPNLKDETNMGKIPRAHINHTESGCEEYHLIVYKALSAIVCLLIDGSIELKFDLLRKLDSFLGVRTSDLASDIADQYSRKIPGPSEVQLKYVYFNQMNLAQKTSVHHDGRKGGNVNIPHDILKLMADLQRDLSSTTEVEDGETIVKTYTEYWVVAKKCDQREFYVVVSHKNANLIEINEEVKKLCSAHFSNIFFLD